MRSGIGQPVGYDLGNELVDLATYEAVKVIEDGQSEQHPISNVAWSLVLRKDNSRLRTNI